VGGGHRHIPCRFPCAARHEGFERRGSGGGRAKLPYPRRERLPAWRAGDDVHGRHGAQELRQQAPLAVSFLPGTGSVSTLYSADTSWTTTATVNDELKKITQVKHSRHICFDNFIVNMLEVIAAYCIFPKKPCINVKRTIYSQLTSF